MEDMIIIDNSVLSFAYQLENGIPILPFYDNFEDNELLFLMNYLCDIAKVKDIRVENKARIKMDYFLQAAKEDVESEYISNKSEDAKSNLIELFEYRV
jgi:CTD small phosphatase-like protein 2